MIEVRRTAEFIGWLASLRDTVGKARIAKRIDRVAGGNLGDHRSVGDGVSELRMDFGPGYRAYYTMRGETVVFLLCGGDKDTQARDIERAKALAKEIE
jgi:putative addiction module killer protein